MELEVGLGLAIITMALALTSVASCARPRPAVYVQHASLLVESDQAEPLAEATFAIDGQTVGATESKGSAAITVSGVAGDRHRIEVHCPEGHLPPSPPYHDLFVRKPEGGGGVSSVAPTFVVRCESALQTARIVVKLEGGPHLPLLRLGREVGRTNDAGETTITMPVESGEDIEIVVDTSSAKGLHPQNPSLTFHVGGAKDESFAFTQKFTATKKPPPPKRAKPTVPVRLGAQIATPT